MDGKTYPINWPLNGRLITKLDGTLIPDGHFQVLENLRYNDGGIEGIKGMTKINASALAKLKVQNGFHFKKSAPSTENHIFVQVTNPADSSSAIYKSDNSTSIPSQDTFTLFKTLTNDNTVYFSEAPDQSMIFCDGYHNFVYSGDEYRCARFINFAPDDSFFYDYTSQVNNSLTTTNNLATLKRSGGGVDAYVKGLWHFNDALTDSSGGSHTWTASGAPAYDTGKFTKGIKLVSTSSQYLYQTDHADFNLSGGVYTIDLWGKITAASTIYYQNTTTDADSYKISVDSGGAIIVTIKKTADPTYTATTATGVLNMTSFQHIAVVQDSTYLYIFVDGMLKLKTAAPTILQNYTGNVQIGYDGTTFCDGILDELRISNGVARYTTSYTVPLSEYSSSTITYIYVCSTRPIEGVKFYVSTANASAATIGGYYWNGSTWTSVGSITDGTDSPAGTPLAQTGYLTFSSTESTAKIRVIDENIGYFYLFTFTGMDDDVKLSQVTVKCPVQDLVDIWDGVPRQIYSCQVYTSAYADYTENVYQLDYDASDATTYATISSLTSSQYIYAGFNERLTGLKVFLGETAVNTNAAIAYVDYWNGSAWTSVGTIVDGTSVSGISFNRTGTISWDAPNKSSEFTTSIGNSSKWYFYRIRFSATLSGTVRIDNIAGLPVQVEITPHRFPVLWQNRLWLLNDQGSNKNSAIGSSYGTVCVFNGSDSGSLTFGGSKEINCGKPLFTRYGGSLYENLIVCKNSETYLVDGVSFSGDANGSGAFVVYQISGTRGCIAPLTMKQCDTGYEVAPGITKHILTWLANSGIVMFDSNSMIEISNDIGDRFFADGTYSINRTLSNKSAAFYDASKGEYHIMIPVGTSATYLNEEWVYDVIRKKWYQVKRGAKYLWSGFEVEDPYGNQYVYGGTGDGFLERLEYGTTFDGVSIAYKFRLPDSLLNASWFNRKKLRGVRLVSKCKTTTSQNVSITHYGDGSTSGSTPAIVSLANNKSGRRFYKDSRSISLMATTHSLEFSITTNDETIGFEPLFVAGWYQIMDEDQE